MADHPALLVVDDEEVVCEACRRIFSRQGFEVDVNTQACTGLQWAIERDYTIILLDIKMPNMDGIQFLEQLRQKRPEVPVLIITGYPSIPNAAAAMRLGACDYVTKPFTSEEITQAVRRVLSTRAPEGEEGQEPGEPNGAAAVATGTETLFWDESWFQIEVDGSATLGALLPGIGEAEVSRVCLPRIGEVVYQGLPLAAVTIADRPLQTIPAPVSGVIVAANDQLLKDPQALVRDPFGEGWIARLCTTQYEDEAHHCRRRRIVLVNADPDASYEQAERLSALGCQVVRATDRGDLVAALEEREHAAVFLDATSLGEDGPPLVALVKGRAPATRVVVVAPSGGAWETAYRQQKIFYYAVAPFADDELIDILAAAFRRHEPPPAAQPPVPSEPISSISLTNRNGHKVHLLAAPGLLWRSEGLGWQITKKALEHLFPVVVTPGVATLTTANILKTAAAYDRLMVLVTRDTGRLPGSLARDTKPEFDVKPGEAAGKITTLTVQPDAAGGFASLDDRTTEALAEHIVREMALY